MLDVVPVIRRLVISFILLASASILFAQAVGGVGVPGANNSGGGTTTNSVTFNTTGGASPGATFNGAAAVTVSPATIGADVSGAAAAVSVAAVPNQNLFYLSTNCGTQANCTTANANTKQCSDASITNTGTTVTSTACGNFTSADVGKRIWAFATCATDSSATATAIIGSATAATITAVASTTSITISQTATGIQANTACIIYGTPDDTAQSNLETAVASSSASYCPGIQFPAGGMMWTSWHLGIADPPGCARNPEVEGATAIGGGFNVAGQGRTQSVIYIDPLISMSGCTLSPGQFTTANAACMVIPLNAEWHDFSFNGGNLSRSGVTSSVNLIGVGGYSVIRNMGFTNFGYADNALAGFYESFTAPVYCINSDFDGWGSTSVKLDPGWMVSSGCDFQDSLGGSTAVVSSIWLTSSHSGDQFISTGGNQFISNTHNSGNVSLIYNNNGASLVHLLNDQCSGQSTVEPIICYNHNANSVAWLTGFNCRAAQFSGQNICIAANTNANIFVRDSTFAASSSGNWIDFEGAGLVHDMGANNIISGPSIQTGASVWSNGILVPYATVNGSCTGTATASSTLGLYGTGPNVTATTCTSTTVGGGQVMTHAGTLGYLQITAATAGVSSSSGVFTVLQNGSATTITCTIGTAAKCYDGTHQVAFAAGDLISIEFTTQASETLAGIKAVLSAY
jgi:hypothetical protein